MLNRSLKNNRARLDNKQLAGSRPKMNMPVVIASLEFPLWLRLDHYINILFIGLMIRSGIQILGAHPRLYWSNRSEPSNHWFKFTKNQWIKFTKNKLANDKLYTSMDDEIAVSSWI